MKPGWIRARARVKTGIVTEDFGPPLKCRNGWRLDPVGGLERLLGVLCHLLVAAGTLGASSCSKQGQRSLTLLSKLQLRQGISEDGTFKCVSAHSCPFQGEEILGSQI